MRIPLANLFVRSPLPRVSELMNEVVACADGVPALIESLIAADQPAVEKHAKEISVLEGKADAAKNVVRSQMPVRLFLQVDRRDALKLLSEIDAIADCAEDVGVLLTLRPLETPKDLEPALRDFVSGALKTVHAAAELVDMIEPLIASGFSGTTAKTVLTKIAALHRLEHEADKLQDQCAKILFKSENTLAPVAVFMWTKVLNKSGDIANHAENVGDQFRLFVAG